MIQKMLSDQLKLSSHRRSASATSSRTKLVFSCASKRWPAESVDAKNNLSHYGLVCQCLPYVFRPALVPRAAPVQAHFVGHTPIFSMMIFRLLTPCDSAFFLLDPAHLQMQQHRNTIYAGNRPKLWRWKWS